MRAILGMLKGLPLLFALSLNCIGYGQTKVKISLKNKLDNLKEETKKDILQGLSELEKEYESSSSARINLWIAQEALQEAGGCGSYRDTLASWMRGNKLQKLPTEGPGKVLLDFFGVLDGDCSDSN